MKTLIMLIASAIIFSFQAIAGPGHGHSHSHKHGKKHNYNKEISQKEAVRLAKKQVMRLLAESKIETSWSKSRHRSNEWLITFENPKVKDKSKRKLFIFLSPSGKFIAANHTGR